ncbi:MAG TPA: class II aldolase/adducin family protein [Candidatus Hydrogenedentes bacterium]|nr:class II aldolase/adducin family protein [Candidatus Hydrogenedentota bacterium]HNT88254.1 class II aldolase/adducin family protein [Candidatus Hydrogenedentota bacterium]
MNDVLRELVGMSRYLGDPSHPYAILGEGNTSARVDEDTFYVKASGTTLANIAEGDFLPVSISRVTAILDDPNAGDADVARVLREALVDRDETRKPSVETMLHALLLRYPEYRFIGHTHPEATNALLCSVRAAEAVAGRLCPDHIVVMGHKSVFVPYVDPGLVLAREVRSRVEQFIDEEGVLPKCILLQNHGLIALGDKPAAVTGVTDMAEKMSRVLLGAYAAGGPRFMSAEDVERIHTRPDEHYRQKQLANR